jgi:CpeT/CpcT family (DUF1001)
MRRWVAMGIGVIGAMLATSGCQTGALARSTPAAANDDALTRLNTALAGEYDNDEQVRQARAAVHAGTALAVPHLRETWRLLDQSRERSFWLWRLQSLDRSDAATALWLYRLAPSADGRRIVATPYRPIDPAKVYAELLDPKFAFRFVPEHWAELTPCAATGEWKNAQFSASVDVSACSALLPGLGESAALLPLRFTVDGEILRTATFADQARGADASVEARRLHWFNGWIAINGGGPKGAAGNQDWHTHNDLRISSEGGRVPIRWRDGAPSGYSLELVRTTYAERKLSVLQLNVVEDASGRVIDYAWTTPNADAVGINLGWLQVGVTKATAEPAR